MTFEEVTTMCAYLQKIDMQKHRMELMLNWAVKADGEGKQINKLMDELNG